MRLLQGCEQAALRGGGEGVGHTSLIGYANNTSNKQFIYDCVVRLSLAEMPEGCGVRLAFQAEGEVLPWHVRGGGESTMLTIAALMYADDLVLWSCDRAELA